MTDAELDKKLRKLLGTSETKAFTLDEKILSSPTVRAKPAFSIKKLAMAAACLAVAAIIALPSFFGGGYQCSSTIEMTVREGRGYFVNPWAKHGLYVHDAASGILERISKLSGWIMVDGDNLYYAVKEKQATVIYQINQQGLTEYARIQGHPVIVGVREDTIYWHEQYSQGQQSTTIYITHRQSGEKKEFITVPFAMFYSSALMEDHLVISRVSPGLVAVDLEDAVITVLFEGVAGDFIEYGNSIVFEGSPDDLQGRKLYIVDNNGENLRLLSQHELNSGASSLFGSKVFYFSEGYLDKDRNYHFRTFSLDLETGEQQILIEEMFFTQLIAGEGGLYCLDPGSGGTLYYYDYATGTLSRVVGK